MNLLNTEELKKQIANGTFTGLDDITNEFLVLALSLRKIYSKR